MKKIIIVLIVSMFLLSCDMYMNYTVQYSVYGTATTANVIYLTNTGDSIELDVELPWFKEIFITNNNPVGLSVRNTSDYEIDVRVYFNKTGTFQPFGREISRTRVNIHGVIH